MKLKYFDDVSDDAVCLIRIDELDSDHERFFVFDKELFYAIKKPDDTIETEVDIDVNCWPAMHVQVEAKLDCRVYAYDEDTSTYKPIAAWTYESLGTGIKYVMIEHKRVGIILPNNQSKMYFPQCYSSRVFSALRNASSNEEGPNEDVTLFDGLCLMSTSDKSRFLQELRSRQKSGYELCSMTTSCVQVDGKLQVVFSSLLQAKEDTKND